MNNCRTCGVEIPDGARFYEIHCVPDVQCEPCAVKSYKDRHPYWNMPVFKNPPQVVRLPLT